MDRTLYVNLTGIPHRKDLHAVITLETVRPRCLDYTSATAVVLSPSGLVKFEIIALTDESALRSIARWFVERFGARGVTRRLASWAAQETQEAA